MSTWLDFADFSDSLSEDESPYLGIYNMKPNEIAAILPRPTNPLINKFFLKQQNSTRVSEESQNEKRIPFDINFTKTTKLVY
jgi:hypothetical protein